MPNGRSKVIKELKREQKTRQTRMIRDGLDEALLDIATFYRDVMMVQASANNAKINKELENKIRAIAEKAKPQSTIKRINAIMDARTNLGLNASPLLTVEALICVLALLLRRQIHYLNDQDSRINNLIRSHYLTSYRSRTLLGEYKSKRAM